MTSENGIKHCVILLDSGYYITIFLNALKSLTRPTDIWRISEVDRLNQLYDKYNHTDLSKKEVSELINSIDMIAFLDVTVISKNDEEIIRIYCFDCNYIDITTSDERLYNQLVSHVFENHLGKQIW